MKVKIVAILTVVILLISYVPVYADTPIPELPANGWEYWLVANVGTESGTYLYYVESHGPIVVQSENDHDLVFNTYRWYRYIDNEWKIVKQGQGTMIMNLEYIEIYAANHDIAYADGSGFFFLSPKVPPLYQEMKKMDFGTILRTFSVGLIPIIGCLILVISLRKGWEFLRTQLTH